MTARIEPTPWRTHPPATGPRTARAVDQATRMLLTGRAGWRCELCASRLRHTWHAHHRKLRSQGRDDTAPNLLALCPECHVNVHRYRQWAEAHGFIVGRWADPADEPVAIHTQRWQLLTPAGGYTDAAAPAEDES